MSEITNHPRELRLDLDWRFHLGDIDAPPANTHIAAYMANKAGYARGAAKPNFDDSDWRTVELPHDWSVEGEFDPSNHMDAGYLPRGVGWYRRRFRLDESDRGKYLAIRFDGVATHCTVYVNGHLLHRNFCGYTPFTIDISDVATFGEDLNVIAVRVDATTMEGWWYEGAGVYRHVWLIKSSHVHFAPDGIFVRPQKFGDEWNTFVELTIDNALDANRGTDLVLEIFGPQGEQVQRSVQYVHGPEVEQTFLLGKPMLWSPASPNLYTLRATIRDGDTILDQCTTRFGYRTLRFDPNDGFFLNDEPVKLKGTCNHQDHAGLGVALPDSIHEFRIRRLMEMGCNAYRSAHNPPASELLDACDRLGMLVIDENRNFGSSPEQLEQLRSMVRRDRNHPCVIAWSICNEEAIQATPAGANIARAMQRAVKELDPTRPVTAAVSGGVLGDGGIADVIEVMGINYQLATHDAYHAKRLGTPIIAVETHCVLSTRATYHTDAERKYFASCDDDTAPWGTKARETWRHVSSRPFVAGMFAWTGFDYRGEPSPHEWPCISSHWGIMDTCGFAKDAFYLHKAYFTREPFVHLLPHWNWPGREGETIRVKAYSTCQSVELFLNDRSLGRKKVDPIEMVEWSVKYQPGKLRAVGYRGEREIASAVVETTGEAVALGMEIPSAAGVNRDLPADGEFAVPITVFATDANGRRVPTTDAHVEFSNSGPARIIGVGSGDPTCHEPDKASARSLFRGLAQVIIQAATTTGTIRLEARADGLRAAALELTARAATMRPFVPPAKQRHWISDWRVSPTSSSRPDPSQTVADSDMNTWERVKLVHAGQSPRVPAGQYAIYRATFTPPKIVQSHGGTIVFHDITGAADALLDGAPISTKGGSYPDKLTFPLPPALRSVTLSLLVHAPENSAGGVTRGVELVPNEPSQSHRAGGPGAT